VHVAILHTGSAILRMIDRVARSRDVTVILSDQNDPGWSDGLQQQ